MERSDTSLLGLKKSWTGVVETPIQSGISNNLGFLLISNAPPPAPWVYSPADSSAYFALSEKITIPIRSSFSVDLATQSSVVCKASTAPIHAKVMSTTSQFLKHSLPYLSEYRCVSISKMYVAVGFAPSNADSVPKYILPIFFGSIPFLSIRFITAFAPMVAVSS